MTGVSPVPYEARPYQGRPAGLVTRSIAALIDVILVLAAAVATHLAVTGIRYLITPLNFEFPRVPVLLGVGSTTGLLALYWTFTWTLTGRSYGARVMGLRVVGRRGLRLRGPVAFARAVLSAIFPVGLLWCAVNGEKRSVQDVILQSSVIYDWKPVPVAAEERTRDRA